MSETARIAVLTSGSGTTAEAFIRATHETDIPLETGVVVCNKPDGKAEVWERIRQLNSKYGTAIEVVEINQWTHPDSANGRGQTDAESAAILQTTEDIDGGLIIARHTITVTPNMTPQMLFATTQFVEKMYLPGDIAAFVADQTAYACL